MGECDIIAHEHGGEGAKGHLVGDEVEHGTHIHQEIDSFITEKGAKEYPDYIEPLRVVGVAPMFYTLYEVHDGIVLNNKKSFTLNIRNFWGRVKGGNVGIPGHGQANVGDELFILLE
jgi:hypothetical protein